MSGLPFRSNRQPLKYSSPKVQSYQIREINIGRISSKVEAGPEIKSAFGGSGSGNGLESLARGIGMWADVLTRQEHERHELEAIENITAFKDKERAALEEMNSLESSDAVAALGFMDEFYKTAGEDLLKTSRGDFQRGIYERVLASNREQGLNSATKHQMAQHAVYRGQVYEGLQTRADSLIMADPKNYQEQTRLKQETLKRFNPGADPGWIAAKGDAIAVKDYETAFDAALAAGDEEAAMAIRRQAEAAKPTLSESGGGGIRVQGARFALPTDKHHYITSPFGPRSAPKTPKGLGSSNHQGIDLRMPTGTPVKAISGGTIEFAGDKGGYGVAVIIKHDDGSTSSQYGHLSRLNVEPGARVKAGDVIALSGNTGKSTGPHLDLKIIENGKYIDPAQVLGITRQGLAGPMEKPQAKGEVAPDKGTIATDAPLNLLASLGGIPIGAGTAEQGAEDIPQETQIEETSQKYGGLVPLDRLQRMDRALAQRRKDEAEVFKAQAKMLPSLAQDEEAMIIDTGVDNPELINEFRQMEKLGIFPEGYTKEYEVKKEKAFNTWRWLSDPANLVLSIPEQMNKAVEELMPDPEKDKGQWLEKKDYLANVIGSLSSQMGQLNSDPMAVVSSLADKVIEKEISTAYLDSNDKAAVFKARVEISQNLAAQMGMGVAGLQNFPLSLAQKESIVQTLAAAGENSQKRLGILNELYEEFGDYSEPAFKQIGVDLSELLAVEAARSGDLRLVRAAQMAVNRPDKITKLTDLTDKAFNAWVDNVISESDYGSLLVGRINNSYGLDNDTQIKYDGLKNFISGIAASMIESGHSQDNAKKELKYVLRGIFKDGISITEDYAGIYLKIDESWQDSDKHNVSGGLEYLAKNLEGENYWINDGDDHFILFDKLKGVNKTFDGARSVRISKADAIYIGAAKSRYTSDYIGEVAGKGRQRRAEAQRRAEEVVKRMRSAPPADKHSLFIENVRANTLKAREVKGNIEFTSGDTYSFNDDSLMTQASM